MKKLNILFLLLNFTLAFSQKTLPVVKSNSTNVKIIESSEITTNWSLNPSLKPDIYMTGKISKFKNVKLISDTDSIQVNLKPGQKFDFVVLLNKKDSCFTRFESPKVLDFSKTKPALHDTIPFRLTKHNNISVKSIMNKKDTINMMFDTGATDFYLLKTAIKKYLNPNGLKLTMEDISNENFKIGNLEWDHQQIYPIETTGHENDGMFGWNAFDGKILEINYDKNIIVAHSKLPKIRKDYEKFPMELMREHFCIVVEMSQNGKKYKNRYLFDSGYQKSVILDSDLLKRNNLSSDNFQSLKETTIYNSQNEPIPVKTVLVNSFRFGRYVLKNVPAMISDSKKAGYTTNFLGNELLKRFNTILDFQKNVVYLKPNKFFNDQFEDLKKL